MDRFVVKRPREDAADNTEDPSKLSRSLAPEAAALLEDLTDASWKAALQNECTKSYFTDLARVVHKERLTKKKIYPPTPEVFTAFNLTPLSSVRVVILGQDPCMRSVRLVICGYLWYSSLPCTLLVCVTRSQITGLPRRTG